MPETGSELLFVAERTPDGGFVATAVGADIITQADSLEELRAMVLDAVRCHVDEGARPARLRLRDLTAEVQDEVLPVAG